MLKKNPFEKYRGSEFIFYCQVFSEICNKNWLNRIRKRFQFLWHVHELFCALLSLMLWNVLSNLFFIGCEVSFNVSCTQFIDFSHKRHFVIAKLIFLWKYSWTTPIRDAEWMNQFEKSLSVGFSCRSRASSNRNRLIRIYLLRNNLWI